MIKIKIKINQRTTTIFLLNGEIKKKNQSNKIYIYIYI